MSDDERRVVLSLVRVDVSECRVFFEPEGAEHLLRSGDASRIETFPPKGEEIGIMLTPEGLSIDAQSSWGTRAWDASGAELKL